MVEVLTVNTKGARNIDPKSIPIGLPQIRITPYWMYGPNPPLQVNAGADGLEPLTGDNLLSIKTQLMINQTLPILDSTFSIGGLSAVSFKYAKEMKEIQSGYPAVTDLIIPLSAATTIECTARELRPYMSALLTGLQAPEALSTTLAADTGYTIGIGNPTLSAYHRVELHYDFPAEGKRFIIVLPKAQITSDEEMSFNESDEMGMSFTITAASASSGTDDIATASWNTMPHGNKVFLDAGTFKNGADDAALFTEFQTGSFVEVAVDNPAPANKRDEAADKFAVVTAGYLDNIKMLKKGVHPVSVVTYGAAGSVVYTSSS